jgi:hypothetical protein
MKIICVDNFNRETIDDSLIAENVNEFYGNKITDFLNKEDRDPNTPNFFRLVPDDHVLFKFEP